LEIKTKQVQALPPQANVARRGCAAGEKGLRLKSWTWREQGRRN